MARYLQNAEKLKWLKMINYCLWKWKDAGYVVYGECPSTSENWEEEEKKSVVVW